MSKHEKKDWNKFKNENKHIDETQDEDQVQLEEVNHPEAALDHPSYMALEEKLTLAEQQAHENWEKSVRAIAELDNVRRRAEREVANAHRYGIEKFVSSLLPVVDSLEQAILLTESAHEKAMREGLELTMKLFLDALQKFDVAQIDPVGEVFDPQQHEAMTIQEVPGSAPNTIIKVFQKGYKLSDRVIRPARVIVSKTGS